MPESETAENFLGILEAHKAIIYKIANSYCKKADERKDLIQEIFIQLWKSFNRYNSNYQYSTWIYRIALNVAISFYRKERTRSSSNNPLEEIDINQFIIENDPDVDHNIHLLLKFIQELNDLDKAIILLHLEEKSYKEISEIVGISETNTATKINRVKTILKQKFSTIQNQ